MMVNLRLLKGSILLVRGYKAAKASMLEGTSVKWRSFLGIGRLSWKWEEGNDMIPIYCSIARRFFIYFYFELDS
jgi:hypothetical protein